MSNKINITSAIYDDFAFQFNFQKKLLKELSEIVKKVYDPVGGSELDSVNFGEYLNFLNG